MNIEKMCEEFRAWWFEGIYPLRRMDRYEDAGVSEELAQEIWQASRAAIEVELPNGGSLAQRMYGPDADGLPLLERHFVVEAIESLGLKVKS